MLSAVRRARMDESVNPFFGLLALDGKADMFPVKLLFRFGVADCTDARRGASR